MSSSMYFYATLLEVRCAPQHAAAKRNAATTVACAQEKYAALCGTGVYMNARGYQEQNVRETAEKRLHASRVNEYAMPQEEARSRAFV